MNHDLAINIDYWAVQEGKSDLWQLAGIEEFQSDLGQEYVSRVHGRPGDLGGGLYEFAIQVIANISIQDVVKLIADGIAFDLLKSGTKSFVLRPFLTAYEKLKARNTEREVDIHEIRFMFNDAEVVVSKICDNSIYESLGAIFQVLARDFNCHRNGNGEYPSPSQVTVIEGPEKKLCRFRVLLDVDDVRPRDGLGKGRVDRLARRHPGVELPRVALRQQDVEAMQRLLGVMVAGHHEHLAR